MTEQEFIDMVNEFLTQKPVAVSLDGGRAWVDIDRAALTPAGHVVLVEGEE